MAAVTVPGVFGAPKNKICHFFHFFPFFVPQVMGPDAMIIVFWMTSFKSAFTLSSFTFIKRFFISSSLSAIRVVSSAYLRLSFHLAVLILDCHPSGPAFLKMSSAYKLNKQVTICSRDALLSRFAVSCFLSGSNYCFLTSIQTVVWFIKFHNSQEVK